jgi:hypothetical protein
MISEPCQNEMTTKMKITCTGDEEVTGKDADMQADIRSVLAMLEGDTDRKKIANYIRA